ncbi:YeeE/YedE thiosulfate transporter family protein [Sinimarinibacterium sp. CAU 1509]|uniref:YeeE/YedE thiosulfate transporter family protein n=1 Tax=Sinimarinibacterium sp. CAU 1509 TaxID=2562283 RepID=UPI00146A1A70|nr:YeeE/YedE thiosulfate transporter family protein [Sinimarinibacterium sp. CAU 1509]
MNLRDRFPPVLAGIVIGISMLLTFVVAGRGIGVSGTMTRLVATVQHWFLPELTEKSAYFGPYFANGAVPLNDYLSYLMVGLLAGAFAGSFFSGDFRFEVQRGPRISRNGRLLLALVGGVIAGFAARLARGCTSGQGLVGGAELSVGSWAFLICIFIGGFGTAWFVRKQWI